jgi:hypothetical protein
MKRTIVWERISAVGLEYAEIELDPLRLEGDVILVENGEPYAVSYGIACDDAGMTLNAFIHMTHAGGQRECMLTRHSDGEWTMNGNSMPLLNGIADVDLSITPSTNTPPIRRLRLAIGQAAQVTAAWVRFPELDVVPLRQSYRRSSGNSYEYEAPELGFATQLECDDEGIVRTYHGLWRLLTE